MLAEWPTMFGQVGRVADHSRDVRESKASSFHDEISSDVPTTQHVVPTLTTQLIAFLSSIRSAVITALANDYMIPTKVLRKQMKKLPLEPMSTATEIPDAPVLIVVDALDERESHVGARNPSCAFPS